MRLSSVRPGASQAAIRQLEQRVADLEADLTEVRRHNLRLAEVVDVVQELLIPMASRDEARIQEAIARFQESL
jgi:hypothetical protein